MPPSVSAAALGDIERALVGLEALCGVLEKALIKRDWQAISQAQADSRRLQHALRNAMEAGAQNRTPEFDATVTARIGRVFAIRADQMARLERYREVVRERLGALIKFKAYAKSVGAKPRDSRLANLNQLR